MHLFFSLILFLNILYFIIIIIIIIINYHDKSCKFQKLSKIIGNYIFFIPSKSPKEIQF